MNYMESGFGQCIMVSEEVYQLALAKAPRDLWASSDFF